jgi:protein tyrosine/serine phosphatase
MLPILKHGGQLMPRYLSVVFGVFIATTLIGGPLGFAYYQQNQIRHFRVVHDGVLYRSGQLSLSGLKRIIHDYGIKTVVTLRDAYYPGDLPPDLEEEDYCLVQDINYFRITPRAWWSQGGAIPADKGVEQFLEVMDNPRHHPVLIHCFAGIHRTGAFCAIYRMEYERWSNAEAIAEMKACGYNNLDDEFDVLGYVEHYQPRWKGLSISRSPSAYNQTTNAPVKRTKKRPSKSIPIE